MFDKIWRPDLTMAEALEMMLVGVVEVKQRLVIAPAHNMIKVIGKNGIRIFKTL